MVRRYRVRADGCAVVAAALLGIVIATGSARATDFSVDSTVDAIDALPGDGICAALGGGCTLRAAIIEANQLAGADAILIPEGTYALTIAGADEDDGLTGDLDVLDGVVIRGAGAGRTVVDGAGLDTVLSLRPPGGGGADGVIEISDLTLAGGSESGVFVDGGAPDGVVISRCSIERNAGTGVAFIGDASPDSALVIDHSVISDNEVGISAQLGTLRVAHGTIERNDEDGIIAADAPIAIEDSLVRANGGTGVRSDSDVRISRTRIEDNTDGGVRCSDNFDLAVEISDSTIAGNTSLLGAGGVALLRVASAAISNSTLSGNSGSNVGGLLISTVATPGLVQDCTITGNAGGRVGGVSPGTVGQPIRLSRTLVAGNTAASAPSDCGHLEESFEVLASADWNLIGNDSGCDLQPQPNDLIGTSASPIDPLLGPLALNGGPTPTHALLTGSPALDAAGTSCAATDQRGSPRPYDADGDGALHCDIGAYEAADFDEDGVPDLTDNCPVDANSGQLDADRDGVGDVCDDDRDGDLVVNALDNCPTIANAEQPDADADGVGDDCDNCLAVPNPRLAADWLAAHAWAVLTGGQRDDDFDGFGNKCDAKFPGSSGTVVGEDDMEEFKASVGLDRETATCGSLGVLPCAIFDLDEGSAPNVSPADTARFKQLFGSEPGPTCPSCPLECEAGALRSCEP